jgi:hypothetical protein
VFTVVHHCVASLMSDLNDFVDRMSDVSLMEGEPYGLPSDSSTDISDSNLDEELKFFVDRLVEDLSRLANTKDGASLTDRDGSLLIHQVMTNDKFVIWSAISTHY